MNLLQKGLLRAIHFYQCEVSIHKQPSCIYYPTCSQYGRDAIKKHGAIKGSIMTICRILRCHPFHQGGVDRVPDRFMLTRNPADRDKVYIESVGIFDRQALKK
ncbi:membrane protein insertion efficiency factor YidD [Allofustis seminis]|uniref:membrane protein insertion efficiency factor YidD n=1 Tax=Allofustis seminis TaxID=166939 RepID=UPI0003756917|nr:membrane protein insertion efficiency factor YidD [Allofustis seminis]